MMARSLNAKQFRFVQEYLISLNASQAAIKAGYSKKTARSQGQRLLTHAGVSAVIKAEQDKMAEKLELTQEMVLKGLLAEATRFGEGTSHSARVAAWTQLGKHSSLAMWKDVVEHQNKTSELTDEELERIARDATRGGNGIAGPPNGAGRPDSVH